MLLVISGHSQHLV